MGQDDLYRLLYHFSNLEHPGDPSQSQFGLDFLARYAYQQWPFLRMGLSEWGRSVALYERTAFAHNYAPEVMSPGWASRLFGTSISNYVSVGFCLLGSAEAGGGFPVLWDRTLSDAIGLHGGLEEFERIASANFIADVAQLKAARRNLVRSFSWEPFSFNPIFERPFVRVGPDGAAIAPCVPAVSFRLNSTGIAYAGIGEWGESFSRDLGHLFERYVGNQLGLMPDVELHPEIPYRYKGSEAKSVDWLLVTPWACFLIECKSTMPARDVREGGPEFMSNHVNKLGKSIKQINRTASAIRSRVKGFEAIPSDRPLIGLTVTLGDYDLANEPDVRRVLPPSDIPLAVVGPEFIEQFAVSRRTLPDIVTDAEQAASSGNVIEPRSLRSRMARAENPILADSFESIPIVRRVKHRRRH